MGGGGARRERESIKMREVYCLSEITFNTKEELKRSDALKHLRPFHRSGSARL